MILTACAPTPAAPPADHDPLPNREAAALAIDTDACAARLHAISGALLFYYLNTQTLPERLDELLEMPGMEEIDGLSCPVSGRRYLYNPDGVRIPEWNAMVVLFDAEPAHDGMRWAVTIEQPRPGEPLVTRVVALPESFFLLHQAGL